MKSRSSLGGRTLIFLVSLLALPALRVGGPAPYSQSSTLSLEGEWKWRLAETAGNNPFDPGLSDEGWQSMRVPSNWFVEGHDLTGSVWLRTTFEMPLDPGGRLITLNFEGVDYSCDVWLNGKHLGAHEGYFEPFQFDVSDSVHALGPNVLAVRVNSPDEEPGPTRTLHKRVIKGIFNHQDNRPGGRWSARGQDHNTGGIWAPVYLRISDGVAIKGLRVDVQPRYGKTEITDGLDWIAAVDFDIESRESCGLEVEAWIRPENFVSGNPSGGDTAEARVVKSGTNKVSLHFVSSNTQLWWSWDQGRPRLYRLTVRLKRGGQLVDRREMDIGFRTVRMDSGTASWWLNGRRVPVKETNYIPTQFLSEMTAGRYSRDMDSMKGANVNAIRVHAHVEPPAFYREADRAGLLVWQDFPLQWGYAQDNAFKTEAVRQVKAMVALLSGHPSIVAWNMHSESPWRSPWMKDRYADYDPLQNKDLDDVLFEVVKAADGSRYIHLGSEGLSLPGSSNLGAARAR
jgi:beta-mannosidase